MGDLKRMQVKVLENKKVADRYFKLSFKGPEIAEDAKPGQFVHIRVSEGFETLLRKPFGVHRVAKSGIIEVLYEVVGTGTGMLSRKRPPEMLDVIGPLGNGFNLPPTTYHLPPILVAGGIGVAPLVFLAQRFVFKNCHSDINKPLVLIGGRTKSHILCETEFKELGCEVKIATDDGSRGHKGLVTDLLKSLLATGDWQLATIYACGPRPMLKEVAAIASRRRIPCQVLLEEYMACGIGVCLGCPVMTKDGYKMVCRDGPVFETNQIIWH